MKENIWTKSYILGVIVLFCISLVSNIILSVLPIFAKNLTGLDTYAGMMTTVYTLGALSMRFVSGKLVGKFSAKIIVIIGIILTLLATIFYLNCTEIAIALVARGVQGIGFGIAQTGITTYITKISARSRMMEAVNYAALFNSAPAVIGPSIAFTIIGAQYNNFNMLFIFAIILIIATLILMFFTKETTNKKMAQSADHQKIVNWEPILFAAVILFLNSVSQSSIQAFASLYAISLGFAGLGSFFLINALGMISTRFVMPTIIKKIGTFKSLLCSSVLFFACFLAISQISEFWQLLLVAFPAGFSVGSVTPVVNAYMVEQMPVHKSGTANAFYYSSMDTGYAVGGLIWGFVAGLSGYSNMLFIAGIVQIICVIFCILQIYRQKLSKQKLSS